MGPSSAFVTGKQYTMSLQDVVYALAHATGKTGRFTLIERWRNNERLLAPHEHPLKVFCCYSNITEFCLTLYYMLVILCS